LACGLFLVLGFFVPFGSAGFSAEPLGLSL